MWHENELLTLLKLAIRVKDIVQANRVYFLAGERLNSSLTQDLKTTMIEINLDALFSPTVLRTGMVVNEKPPKKTRKGHSDGYCVAGTGLEPVTFGL